MRTVSARAVPPPPSSVVTKTLPISSAAVSNIPTASISSIRTDQGAPNAVTAAVRLRLLRLVRQDVRRAERQEIKRLAAGVEVEHEVRRRQQVALDVVGDLLGHACRPAGRGSCG